MKKYINQKGITNILLIILVVSVLIAIYTSFQKKQSLKEFFNIDTSENVQFIGSTFSDTPTLSRDKKDIILDRKVLLEIEEDVIFNWFKKNSGLCDESNINTSTERKAFCESKVSFRSKTRFNSIVISPDKNLIGFSIESDILSPDRTVGVFSLSSSKVSILTNYYLGNEFISFSPEGINFIYQSGCFEGKCALYVKNSENLQNKIILSDSEYPDARTKNVTFLRWISDNEIEYILGTEVKRAPF